MRISYPTKRGAPWGDLKREFDQRIPCAKDAIADSGLLDFRSLLPTTMILDAGMAMGLVSPVARHGGAAPYAHGLAIERDGNATAVPVEEEPNAGLGVSASAASSEEAVAFPNAAYNPSVALTGLTTNSAEALVVPAVSAPSAPVDQDAVGGGLGVATSLELAYEDPGSLSDDGTQASLLAVTDPAREIRAPREKLAGSPRGDRIVGGPGRNEIDGREGNDELVGGASDDVFIGGAGDDVLDGGAGADIARYRGSVLEYDISRISSTQARIRHARFRPGQNDGNDLARNVKRLDFKDRKVFLDGSNNAPQAQADEGLSVVDGRSLTIPFSRLLGNDVDFDGDRLTITQVKGKPADSARIVGNSVVFTPPVGIQWALASFSSYETTFLYTVSDGKGGTATASAAVTINRPRDLRGLRTGPADISQDGAGGPGESPGAIFTKVSGQSVAGTGADDLILVPSSGAMTGGTVDGAGGVDELRFTNVGTAQTLTLGSTLTNVEQVVIGTGSGPIADTSGTTANNVNASGVGYGLLMTGNAGANTLTGTAFGDQIDGGIGVDRMVGGAGSDTYSVDNTGDIVTESSSTGGTDTVFASVSYTLPARVENLTLTGTGNINGTGNSLANTLIGNAGNNTLSGSGGTDTLDGGLGADSMAGGTGNDTYVVDNVDDVVTEASGAGTDTVRSSLAYTLGSNVEHLVLTGTDHIAGTGNTLNNTITGNAGNNALDGGNGTDTMIGGAGDDSYFISVATDVVTENAGEGTDTVNAGVTYTLGANIENLVLTGTANLNGTGNALDNLLTGNAGNNLLDGLTGVDTARFSGARANYSVATEAGGGFLVTDLRTGAPDGADTVRNVELLQFADVTEPPGGPNQPPVANNDSGFVTPLNTPLTIAAATLLANDTDANGNPLTVSAVSNPSNGTVVLNAGNVVFTPTSGYGGPASFTYTASDGQATSNSATVSLTVSAANEIVLENAKPGNPKTEWDVTNYDTRIEGYAAQFSVNKGEDVQFKIKSDAAYQIDIYRLGYYAGDGARKVATIGSLPISSQPNPVTDASTGLVDAGNWSVSATWAMPADAVSGVYVAKLVRNGGGANHIPFVVRDDTGNSDLLFQTADTTWQAYNDWGGNSLYSGSPAGRAYKVSYNRPMNTRFGSAPGQPEDFLFDSEYPTIRFLEANGYDVSYFSGIDSDRRGAEIREHNVFLSVGHDEYWSAGQRANVEAARDAGVDLAFFSGNEVFWKTRWEDNYATLVSYKETHPTGIDDPEAPATGTWRDPRFGTDAGRPENSLTGQIFMVNDGSDPPTRITVPAEDGQLRFWRNTGLGSSSTQLTSDILSYEWDEDLDNGSRPAGLIRLSSTTDPSTSYLQDHGSTYGTAPATHSLTMYRAPSGALVFGAGTTQWGWGLDAVHDGSSPIDSRIRQATVNLFADMGVQPTTLISGLTAATASTDTTRPTSTITSPTGGSTLQPGTPVTITGTASDVGGRVGGMEVSTDGGTTWRRAEGRSNWSYSWTPTVNGSFNIKSRAADDSLNLETPGAGVNVTVGSGGGGSGTFSLWSASTTPAVVTDPDAAPIEVGVKFVPGQAGQITGIRFYKGPQNLGTHIGNLWTSTGTQLATATFTNETASGWQQVNFANPVTVTAGTTYVASYFAPQGKYSVNENYFNAAYTNGPLTAPATGTSGGNGVYRYNATSAFPNSTFAASNYWVDVVLQTGPVNQPPIANPDTRSTNEDTALTLAATDLTSNDTDPENNPLSITAVGGATNGAVVLNGSNVTFTPAANYNGPAVFTYTLSDGNSTATGNVSVTVNPVNDPPVAVNDSGFTTPFQTVLNIPTSTLLGNDTDADNDTLTVESVQGAVNGTVTPPGQTGNVVFTPNPGYSGPASFTYTIKDPSNAQATATVSLTVGASGNQPPNAVADSATTNEDSPVTISVLANDSDPDGHPLTVTLLNLTGTQGSATINANNTITYNPGAAFQSLDAGQQGTDTFTYTVSDSQGATATAAVTVTVTGLDDAGPNRIVAENQLPGTPQSVWGINGPTTAIEGFATDISVDQGQRVDFKVNTVASDYRIDIYRMGYYQGNGARYITSIEPSAFPNQPAPLRDTSTGLADAGNWSVTASWNVPTDAVSGVYIGHLVREDGTLGENHMYFVVRDDDGRSDLLVQTADATWQAYNLWGGENFYTGTPSSPTQAKKVSYNRPFGTATNSVNAPLFDAEYPMIRWLEANGYNASYTTNVDTERRGQELLEHKAFVSMGHDEYWSNQQRVNVEVARDAGVDLAFFSGNEVYWKTRWENSIDGSGTPNRTLVSYKETWSNAKVDPNPAWTGTWRDPRFSPPADGGRPENRLTGTIFQVDSYRTDTIEVPAADGKMRFWRNTSIANLGAGQTATLNPNVLGYEWDEDRDNGFRPPGAIKLSTTTLGVSQYLLDYGNSTGPATATHNLTLYKAPSGALVFGAGTTRWSWGLDSEHINETSTPDPRMQQATVNLFADMGIQPGSLQAGLVPTSASTDAVAPVSSITTPSGGSSFPVGQTVTITGTASDTGGRVGGVEVSVDNGTSWHPASGRENWSYSWRPTTPGSAVIKSRATDDSLNMQVPGAGVTVNVQAATGPWSLFGTTAVPTQINVNDPNPVELGVKFRSDIDASITSLRFYKGSQDTGTHVGSIWTATGTRLASATFTNETASGWQQVDFATPVAVQAGQTYVASYHTPTGFYSADVGYFSTQGVDVGPLHAPASPLVSGGNGVYAYGASAFPTNTWNGSNYWVDVVMANA